MFWIKDNEGDGINLAMAKSLEARYQKDEWWELRVFMIGDEAEAYFILHSGTEAEVKEKRDELITSMILFQNQRR